MILNITDQQGIRREFSLIGPGGIAGRVDPFVVPLPVGATFAIPIDLSKYWPAGSKEFNYKLKAGTFRIQAEFKGRSVSEKEANLDSKYAALLPYWEGVVESNELRFESSGQ